MVCCLLNIELFEQMLNEADVYLKWTFILLTLTWQQIQSFNYCFFLSLFSLSDSPYSKIIILAF